MLNVLDRKVTHMVTKMVDIGGKMVVERTAVARGELQLKPATLTAIQDGTIKKGDVLTTAQLAGIQAVKNTSSVIPLCHPIPINYSNIEFELNEKESKVIATCEVKADYKTGVEMEALTGVSVALLTVWDMVKYIEKNSDGQYPDIKIMNIEVLRKTKTE